jgi:hypothetical protein
VFVEREVPDEGGQGGCHGRDERHADTRPPSTRSADEDQAPARSNGTDGVLRDVERQPEMFVYVAARPFEVELGQRRVVRSTRCYEHVVDRFRQRLEEALEPLGIGRIESCAASRTELACDLLMVNAEPR